MQTHENASSFRKVTLGSDRKFGLTFGAIFALIAFWPLFHHHSPRWGFLVAGVIMAVVALARPAALAPLNRAWFRLGLLLNKVANPIIMGLMFFGAVTPLGWLMRKRGGDPLSLKMAPQASTYWIAREPDGAGQGSLTKQF